MSAAPDPRLAIGAAMRALGRPNADSFARLLVDGVEGMLPCWGGLADAFEALFTSDHERIAAWGALVEAGELPALVLFLDLNRDRPEVLRAAVAHARHLPATIQVALVTLERTPAPNPKDVPRLHPAARAALADDTVRARERGFYAVCAQSLRAQRVPLWRER